MISFNMKILVFLLAALLLWSAVSAEDEKGAGGKKDGGKSIPDAETVWKQVDADGDGQTTPEELVDVIKENTGLDAESAKYYALIFDEDDNKKINKKEFDDLWSYVVIS